jgi:hypothetical protein
LRSYLAAFGMSLPPRLEPERPRTDATLAEALLHTTRGRKRASVLYIASPVPDEARWAQLAPVFRNLPRRRTSVTWLVPSERLGLGLPEGALGRAAGIAARLHVEGALRRGERELRRLGVRLQHLPEAQRRHSALTDPPG